jgi:hypothetical protein
LVADFPQAKFIRTIRDPISSVDRLLDCWFDAELLQYRQPSVGKVATGDSFIPPARSISALAAWTVAINDFGGQSNFHP